MSDVLLPAPPLDLMQRVAVRRGTPAEMEADFLQGGKGRYEMIRSLLPSDWSFAGKSVLDFGCGPPG